MEAAVRAFFEQIRDDYRVTPAHISLYVAILCLWEELGSPPHIVVIREELMRRSRVLGRTTYFLCLRDLAAWGYIVYRPERAHGKRSKIIFDKSF